MNKPNVAVITMRLSVTALADVWNERDHKHATLHFITDNVFRRVLRCARELLHPLKKQDEYVHRHCRALLFAFGSAIRHIEKLNDLEGYLKIRMEVLLPNSRVISSQPFDEYAWFRRTYCRMLADMCSAWATEQMMPDEYNIWLQKTYQQFSSSFTAMTENPTDWDNFVIELK